MQLRNLINHRNVGKGKKITSHVNQIEDFLELVITCHLVAAAMHFFSMCSVSDEPHSNGFPSNIAEMELYRRKNIFFSKLGKIIDEYVVPRDFSVEKVKPATTQSTTGNPHLARILLGASILFSACAMSTTQSSSFSHIGCCSFTGKSGCEEGRPRWHI